MAWIARNKDGILNIFEKEVNSDKYGRWRHNELIAFNVYDDNFGIILPSDADEKLIGRHLTWEDEPVEI